MFGNIMRTFFKRYLKYILLAAAFAAVLCILGAFTLQDVAETEARKSSYTRTEFDFFISSPDSAQAETIESDPSVGALFPYYALSNAFAETAAAEVFLLLSDDMQDASISLFGEKLLVEGEFDESGAMLDLLAAEKLGVSELMPLFCELDEVMITLQHGVLHRKQTLANGGEFCDYYITGNRE